MSEPDRALAAAIDDFTVAVSTELAKVPHAVPRSLDVMRIELRRDAFAIAAAVIDSDFAHADVELRSYLWALSRVYTDIEAVTPTQARQAHLIDNARVFLESVPALFRELIGLDLTSGISSSSAYYEHAIRLAFTAVALDEISSPFELNAVEAFRGYLVDARRDAGLTQAGANRTQDSSPPSPASPDKEMPRSIDELLAELDALVGLASVKHEVRLVTAFLRVQKLRHDRGLPVTAMSRHLVFTGNPGTGKTSVARLLAQIYRTLGVVARGQLFETDRVGLVAGYVGQTAAKVQAAFDAADQGVLLIDEAYALIRGGDHDFGMEAIDTIVKLVEDRRARIVVIMTGYPDEMAALINMNPGLSSRFPRTIEFPDYTNDELCAIFESIATSGGYRLEDPARTAARAWIETRPRVKGFGNAREVRNLFEASISLHAVRVTVIAAPSDDDLVVLHAEDIGI